LEERGRVKEKDPKTSNPLEEKEITEEGGRLGIGK